MRRIVVTFILLIGTAGVAAAQSEGKISVGGSVTLVQPTDDDVDSVVGIAFVARLNPRRGWGPAAAFNWFRADLANPSGGGGDFARLRVRPLLAGVAYSIESGRLMTSFSIVAGPSFNKVDFEDDFLSTVLPPPGGNPPEIDVETSLAVRPGVNLTLTVAPRVAVVGFGGYLFNRPDVVYRDLFGTEFRDRWKADAFVLSAGMVYSLF
jgi:hypothetical protein